jgi:hypothetical protein
LVDRTTKKQLGGATGKGFKPGKSGNPKGRPKGTNTLAMLLKKIGEEELDGTEFDKREAIMRKVYKMAFDGQPWAVQFIADRTEGKPTQPTADVSDGWQQFLDGVFEDKQE